MSNHGSFRRKPKENIIIHKRIAATVHGSNKTASTQCSFSMRHMLSSAVRVSRSPKCQVAGACRFHAAGQHRQSKPPHQGLSLRLSGLLKCRPSGFQGSGCYGLKKLRVFGFGDVWCIPFFQSVFVREVCGFTRMAACLKSRARFGASNNSPRPCWEDAAWLALSAAATTTCQFSCKGNPIPDTRYPKPQTPNLHPKHQKTLNESSNLFLGSSTLTLSAAPRLRFL